jgi:hypothetical protein
VLHTHSPQLQGEPTSAAARNQVIEDLSNAYYNAFVAMNQRADALQERGGLLNLVPVSAGIYAGEFAVDKHDAPHLDRSYTITAIMIAIGELMRRGKTPVQLTLYCYAADSYHETVDLLSQLKSGNS